MKFPEKYRWNPTANSFLCTEPGERQGMFAIPGRDANGRELKVLASNGDQCGWEHVSVSLMDRANACPSWAEMCIVKALFWDDEEAVIQFHPPKSEYVNAHPGCLHLWKQADAEFPVPPSILVGPKP